jgi:flavin-dependent dehydrogenase
MQKEKIRIAGAGLSGLTAAICLARMGHAVDVFEKNSETGQDRGPEWDAFENWTSNKDLFEVLPQWGIAKTFELVCPEQIEVYDPSGECFPLTSVRPMIYLVRRGMEPGSLDQSLKEQALEQGVRIHYDHSQAAGEVDIWAVGIEQNGFFLSVGVTFRTTRPDVAAYLVNPQVAPKAFASLTVVNGMGKINVLLTQDYQSARQYLNTAMEIFQRLKSLDMEDVRIYSGFGGRLNRIGGDHPGTIAVGEAAGFQDFFAGFGARFALLSGHLAAMAIHRRVDYPSVVRHNILPLIQASLVHRMMYDWAGERLMRGFLHKYSGAQGALEKIGEWYRGSSIERLLYPLALRKYRARRVYDED